MAEYGNNYDYGESPLYKDEELPVSANEYYCDLSQSETGAGTEIDPFNYAQFINYFDPSDGLECAVTPGAGDIINIKNVAHLIGRTSFLHMNRDIAGTIIVRPWDLLNNGMWQIETRDLSDSVIDLISNQDNLAVEHLIMRHFIFLQNNTGANAVAMLTDITHSGPNPIVELKNYIVYCRTGDIDCSVLSDVTSKHHGFTYKADEVVLTIGGVGSDLHMYCGAIKANQLIDV